jgi:hypothetical protein
MHPLPDPKAAHPKKTNSGHGAGKRGKKFVAEFLPASGRIRVGSASVNPEIDIYQLC